MLIALLAVVLGAIVALDNGVGETPAMGYNTWNDFRCFISAKKVMEVADKMAEMGLAAFGYEYINIDDCWASGRTAEGELIPDPLTFPDGMKAVADYVHSKGFKFGIYTDRGNRTCAGRPGSGGHEYIDANTFASWGVDYLKEDSCNASGIHSVAFEEYGLMRDALNQTGRPIYFSLCGWSSWYAPEGWTLGNSWRINGDCNKWPSVVAAIFVNSNLSQYAHSGGWNDPDMLVGSNPLAAVFNSKNQSRTQFSLWCIMSAPLLIGSNILQMTAFDLETYTNSEVIAIDQDALGIQGKIIWQNCDYQDNKVPSCQQIWGKPLFDGSWAVLFVNYDIFPASAVCDSECFSSFGMKTASVRDVWKHENIGNFSRFSAHLDGDGASQTYIFTNVD